MNPETYTHALPYSPKELLQRFARLPHAAVGMVATLNAHLALAPDHRMTMEQAEVVLRIRTDHLKHLFGQVLGEFFDVDPGGFIRAPH
jgi:hypothetical protein